MNQTLPIPPACDGTTCPVQYGAICWRMHRGKVEVLLITSRDTGRWVIPKGWPMEKLSPAQAAMQEAWEEAGVRGQIAEASLGTFNYLKILSLKRSVQCAVQVFALRVSELADKFPEKKERRRKWFAAEKAAGKVMEPELRNLLADLPNQLGDGAAAQAPETGQALAKA